MLPAPVFRFPPILDSDHRNRRLSSHPCSFGDRPEHGRTRPSATTGFKTAIERKEVFATSTTSAATLVASPALSIRLQRRPTGPRTQSKGSRQFPWGTGASDAAKANVNLARGVSLRAGRWSNPLPWGGVGRADDGLRDAIVVVFVVGIAAHTTASRRPPWLLRRGR